MTWRTVAGLAVAGAAGFILRAATGPGRAARMDGERTRLADLERRMESLERVDRPGRPSGGRAPHVQPPAGAPTSANATADMATSPTHEPTGAPQPPSADEQVADRLVLLEDALRGGTAAPGLERETWSKVQSGLARPEFAGTTLSSLACTATLCRVEAVHETDAEANRFCRELGRELGFRSRFWTLTDLDDGRVVSLQFMAPRGHHLPRLPEDTALYPASKAEPSPQ